jgi:acyl-homoserine lactone acylase PvdQ
VRQRLSLLAALAAALALPGSAWGAAFEYQQNDGRGFFNIAPPGANGTANLTQIGAFLGAGQRPPHNDDQLAMYGDLVYATPGLRASDLGRYFKDASFGVRPGDEERTYAPRSDVTIVRDRGFGVPHIYGDTRAGAMFGAGYVAAEDRLFFIDVLRHLGRAQLASFVGGAQGNRDFDREQWSIAPYTEDDLQRQVDQFDDLYGAAGAQVQEDAANYVAGVNAYITQAKVDSSKMPGEYAAINRPQGPDPWKATDVVATAALVGAIFGKGGGAELDSALLLQTARERFGRTRGKRVWSDFRAAEDPEAPTTVFKKRFPYQVPPKRPVAASIAMPDRGSVKRTGPRHQQTSGGGDDGGGGPLPPLPGGLGLPGGFGGAFPRAGSNALLVSGRESESGHPLAVFGPQAAYFAPQILMEQDMHAPDIDARGVAFPGTNLYVQLGRGRDYSWSATSAGQDNTDTFAVPLCDPGGGPATIDSAGYRYRGACRPFEVLERTNSWTPSAADQTPAGSETIRAERSALGLVVARATVKGKPVAYTSLRATYFHEIDSAVGFIDLNDPAKIKGPRDFQRATSKIGYTFNWLYADDRDIAYFNSGNNPVRASRTDPNFPVDARYEWRDFDPGKLTSAYTPPAQHPQTINQQFITSWNNKQAPGYRASDGNFGFTSVYRSQTLDDRIKRAIKGSAKMSLVEVIDAMEDAGTVDLRGDTVLPLALKVLGSQRDPALRAAIAKLRAWARSGTHRRDRNRDGAYDHAEAVRIMDAWWPLLLQAQFQPVLGSKLYKEIQRLLEIDNAPNNHGQHLGSAYQSGWYGYANKDLRAVLGRRVRGRYSRRYCGGGSLRKCRQRLAGSLKVALKNADAARLYGEDPQCRGLEGDALQMCFDSVIHRPLGAVTQPRIHWINRPTFQQANEVQSHRGR